MILASVSSLHSETFNECSPVQWVDIDMILASDSWSQYETSTYCSPVQWVEIDMILVSVSWSQYETSNDCSPVQWVDIDMITRIFDPSFHFKMVSLSPGVSMFECHHTANTCGKCLNGITYQGSLR